MTKVLIVDDEPNIREGLKLIIEWEKLGYSVVAEAANGREALLLIEKYKPELVITDIKMPEVSGLDMIRECKNINKEICFIILSGHNEFDLAREALHLGAYKYLLKPVDEEELEKTLIDFNKERERGKSNKISKKFFLKTQLQKLLSNDSDITISDIKDSFNLTNEISYYYAYIDFHNRSDVDIQKIEQLIYENLPDGVLTSIILEKHSWYGLLIHSGMLKNFRNHVNRFCIQLVSESFNRYGYEISIYVGSQKHSILDLKKSRDDALKTADHRYYREIGSVIEYQNINNLEFNNNYVDLPIIEEIVSSIVKGEKEKQDDKITKLISIFRDEYHSTKIIYLHLNRLLNFIINAVSEINGKVESIIKSADFITNREEHIYLSGLKAKLTQLVNSASETINKYKVKSNTADELKDYIDLNFRENLSLKYTADILNVNSAYLGQIFKKQYGVSFNQYLHKLRITEAKQLLVNTNLKIYEIANMVGYQDVNYFMKKFEAALNTTPNTYRKNHSAF